MRKSFAEVLSQVFFGITVAITIAQIFTIKTALYRNLLIVISLGFLVAGIYYYFIHQGHYNALGGLKKVLDEALDDDGYSVDYIENEARLRDLWELDQICYGEENISIEVLRAWWKTYEKGIYLLKEKNRVVGAFGLFPMSKHGFREILEGKAREEDITPDFIETDMNPLGHQEWYLSGIALRVAFRRTHAVRYLIASALEMWLEAHTLNARIKIVALAYTKEGEALLKRFGFCMYKERRETMSRYPVYLYETKKLDRFQEVVNRLISTRAKKAKVKSRNIV